MKEFNELVEVADTLLGPNGCPWDKEQTFMSLQKYFLEEPYELIEAIDKEDNEEIMEEAGDVLYGIIFLAKIAEKNHLFSLKEILQHVKEKLIRRHPHIFGEDIIHTPQEVEKKWDEIKKVEKKHRKSLLDGIPSHLPLLFKAEKIFSKTKDFLPGGQPKEKFTDEKQAATALMELVKKAHFSKIPLEDAFRRYLMELEKEIREKENAGDFPKA